MDRVRSYGVILDPDRHRQIRRIFFYRQDLYGELQDIATIVEGVLSNDATAEYDGMLRMENVTLDWFGCFDGSIDTLLGTAGVLPKLIEFMGRENVPPIQLVASSVLRQITTLKKLEHIRMVASEVNVVPTLVNILESVDSSKKLKENAAVILCNVSIVSDDVKNSIMNLGTLSTLGSLLSIPNNTVTKRVVAATLAGLCSRSVPAIREVKTPMFQALKILVGSYDNDTAFHACFAVSYIAKIDILSVLDNFGTLFIGILTKWLNMHFGLVAPQLELVLMTLVNISASNSTYPKILIKEGILICLSRIFDGGEEYLWDEEYFSFDKGPKDRESGNEFRRMVQKYALRMISNLTAGSPHQIQLVIQRNIVTRLICFLGNDGLDVKTEGVWAISNGMLCGSSDQLRYFLEKGCMDPLCDLLACGDPYIVTFCLETIEGVGIRNQVEDWHRYIIDVEGVEKLKRLFDHEDSEISSKAVDIYYRYLHAYDIEEVAAEYNAFNLNIPPYVISFET